MKVWPSILRILAMGLAGVSLAWGVTLPVSVVAAATGAAIGVVAGGRLGRSSLRLWALLAAIAGIVAATEIAAHLLLDTSFFAARFGVGTILRAASVLRVGAFALGTTAALRTIALRRPVLVGLELAVVAGALPLSFAAHRDGVIARPLWLGDWAWARGIDPAVALLAIGGAAVLVLAVLLLAEGGSRRAPSAFLTLALLTLLAILGLRKIGLPQPDVTGGLGLDGGTGDGGALDAGASADGGRGRRHRRGDGGQALDAGESADGGDEDDDGADGGASEQPPDLDKASSAGSGDAPMAIVVLDDDYSPPSQGYYFRQDAWSELNGTRLVRATQSDVDTDVPESFPIAPVDVTGAPPITGRATVHTLVALLVDHPRPFGLESPTRLEPAKNPNPARFKRAYRVVSRAESGPYAELFGKRAGDPSWSADVRAHYLAVPDDPRYAALARSIVDHAPPRMRADAFGQAVAVKLKLDEAFKYSTSHKHAGAVDPTADFLFGDRIGYCVHFAHAAVYLWRTLGIPARVGTGYHVDEDERHGGSSMLIRSRDAHAWPELYLEGAGWIVLDIAPKVNLDPPSPPVDTELQRMLGEMARELPEDPKDLSSSPSLPSGLVRDVARGLLAVIAAVILALYLIKLWRRLAPRWASAELEPWVGYRAALDLLSEVGVIRRFGESRESFARRVRGIAPSFEGLTSLHLRAALGRRESPPSDQTSDQASTELQRAWNGELAKLRGELRRAVRPRRRLAGWLDPASFLRSR